MVHNIYVSSTSANKLFKYNADRKLASGLLMQQGQYIFYMQRAVITTHSPPRDRTFRIIIVP